MPFFVCTIIKVIGKLQTRTYSYQYLKKYVVLHLLIVYIYRLEVVNGKKSPLRV